MNANAVYKIVSMDNWREHDSVIVDEAADVGCEYIHACSPDQIDTIRERFFAGKATVAVEIDLHAIAMAGFKIAYESNRPGGAHYWHFYRPAPGELVPTSVCKRFILYHAGAASN